MRIEFVTCYFNAAGFAAPRRNALAFFERFAPHGRVNLVELAFGQEEFPLPHELPNIAKRWQLRSNTILWQKERLLNVAIQQLLDDGADAVCWLDCDLVFPEPDLAARLGKALEDADLVQGFAAARRLTKGQTHRLLVGDATDYPAPNRGYAHMWRDGVPFKGDQGLAWAARAPFLRKAGGLFDCGILGGGDTFLLQAAAGTSCQITPGFAVAFDEYRSKVCGARIGYAEGEVLHLYHGSTANRRYADRYEIAKQFGFDPATDISHIGGAYRWASNKQEMHAAVAEYFQSRKEDE